MFLGSGLENKVIPVGLEKFTKFQYVYYSAWGSLTVNTLRSNVGRYFSRQKSGEYKVGRLKGKQLIENSPVIREILKACIDVYHIVSPGFLVR